MKKQITTLENRLLISLVRHCIEPHYTIILRARGTMKKTRCCDCETRNSTKLGIYIKDNKINQTVATEEFLRACLENKRRDVNGQYYIFL